MSLNPNLYTILSEASEPTQVTAQYVWGARPGHRDELILRDRDTGGDGGLDERLYCLMDYFDPTAVIDPAGAVVERYGWSAFGQRRVMDADWEQLAASEVAFDFGFHGQFLDGETGYYNYGYRYYSPEIGRWLSRDPIREGGGLNLYAYASNNAVDRVDYLGLLPVLSTENVTFSHNYCGEELWAVNWRLSEAPAENGYIFQNVTFNYDVQNCCGGDQRVESFSYQELWHLKLSDKTTGQEGSMTWQGKFANDHFFFGSFGRGTKGTVSISGSAQFVVMEFIPKGFCLEQPRCS